MFLPLRDENPTFRLPVWTLSLIAVNVAVFIFSAFSQPGLESFILKYGAVPHEIVRLSSPQTLLTSMFVHASLLHLLGNMLYLWVFGNNVEDFLGPVRFPLFYLASGCAAGLLQVAFSPGSRLPMVGASGAIAGILGAYWVLFPRARVVTLIFIALVPLPAGFVLGVWFLAQLLNIGMGGGVAWFAHIGGFLAGIGMIRIGLRQGTWRRAVPRS
ncbi:MAG: rhomboid family intramembrane serine protease [Candidatus Aminicenantales bacterium]